MSWSEAEFWSRSRNERSTLDLSRLAVLNELKDLLSSLPMSQTPRIVSELNLPQVIGSLKHSDGKEIGLICEILHLSFATMAIGAPFQLFTSDFQTFLCSADARIRLMAVNEVYRTITSSSASELLWTEYFDIIAIIVKCLGDTDLKIATKAMEILAHVDVLNYPQILKQMKAALDGSSSARCNGYDVIVTIASKSPQHLDKCIEEGYIQSFVEELKTKDILYQLNILELLSKFAMSTHGLNYLINNHILKHLAEIMVTLEKDPMGKILSPGLIKFFGSIAHIYPKQITEEFPAIMEMIFQAINNGDEALLMVSLDTLGFIAATIEGKLSLGALGHALPSTLKVIGTYIKNSPSQLRLRSLNCLAHLIAIETDPNVKIGNAVDHRITLMTREWFRSISNHPSAMDVLVTMCKIPFSDLKLAAFGLLDAICQHHWGEEFVTQTPGFLEFLLDRSVDHSQESKLTKWEVLRRLSKSASFDANVIMKLKTYVEEGPYYVEIVTEVAMEGE